MASATALAAWMLAVRTAWGFSLSRKAEGPVAEATCVAMVVYLEREMCCYLERYFFELHAKKSRCLDGNFRLGGCCLLARIKATRFIRKRNKAPYSPTASYPEVKADLASGSILGRFLRPQ
jgi:hypothetical protein